MRHIVVCAVLFLVVSCSPGGASKRGVEPGLNWQALADGSQMAVGPTDPAGSGAGSLIRCWKIDTGYDCVAIDGNEYRDIRRTLTAELPNQIWSKTVPAGYECQVSNYLGLGYRERISNNAGQLTEHRGSNFSGNIQGSWTKDYVERYFEANSIQPETRWMNCLSMTRVIAPNSNATLGSSDVTRAVLDLPGG